MKPSSCLAQVGVGVLLMGLVSAMSVGCAAPAEDEEGEAGDALSSSECEPRATSAKTKFAATCAKTFDPAKATDAHNKCVADTKKPFDDATEACNAAKRAANLVTAEITASCAADKPCETLFSDSASAAAYTAATKSKDEGVRKNAAAMCKSLQTRARSECENAALTLTADSAAKQDMDEKCGGFFSGLADKAKLAWGVAKCNAQKEAAAQDLATCKDTGAKGAYDAEWAACRKQPAGKSGEVCVPTEYAQKGYRCGIVKTGGGLIRAEFNECEAQAACKEFDSVRATAGEFCELTTGNTCTTSGEGCDGRRVVQLGVSKGKPVVQNACVAASK